MMVVDRLDATVAGAGQVYREVPANRVRHKPLTEMQASKWLKGKWQQHDRVIMLAYGNHASSSIIECGGRRHCRQRRLTRASRLGWKAALHLNCPRHDGK
jgi:hypothetical protein